MTGHGLTQQHLIFYGCLVVAVILHEISHGVVAYAYGDDTAKRAGRLTLNPILGLFILRPIPPLDGASLIERVLPARSLQAYWKFRPYGFLVLFLGLFYFNFFGRILDPFLGDLCRYLIRP